MKKPDRRGRTFSPPVYRGTWLSLFLVAVLSCGCARWSIKDRIFPPPTAGGIEGVRRVGLDNPPDYEYRLGPGDTILIRFFYYPEMLEPVVEVPTSGIIHLPLVGGVQVLGYSEPELNALLKEKYAERLMFPDVVARISGRRHDGVYMDGVAAGVATIPYYNSLTLLQSLQKVAMAREGGALRSVIVIRGLNTPQYRAFRVNAKDILRGKENDIYLEPNDIVYVPKKFIYDVNYFMARYVDDVLGRHIMPASIFPQVFPYTGSIDYQIGIDFEDF